MLGTLQRPVPSCSFTSDHQLVNINFLQINCSPSLMISRSGGLPPVTSIAHRLGKPYTTHASSKLMMKTYMYLYTCTCRGCTSTQHHGLTWPLGYTDTTVLQCSEWVCGLLLQRSRDTPLRKFKTLCACSPSVSFISLLLSEKQGN